MNKEIHANSPLIRGKGHTVIASRRDTRGFASPHDPFLRVEGGGGNKSLACL